MPTPKPRAFLSSSFAVQGVAFTFFAAFQLLAQSNAQSTPGIGQQQTGRMTGGVTGAATNRGINAPNSLPGDVSRMTLMPGSMIQLRVFQEPDLDGDYRLDKQGNILVPIVGLIPLGALNLREAEAAIEAKLVTSQVLKVADVTVNILEVGSSNVTVMGEVVAPGSYPLLGSQRLIDVLSMAGGETTLAGNQIVIQRLNHPLGNGETVHYNRNGNELASLNAIINPGDVVIVKRAGIVYVLGAVNHPGGYVMQEAGEINLDQALAMAWGTSIEAKVSEIRVFRKLSDGSVAEIKVSYKKINDGKATPLQLQAQDVVYVPPSRSKEMLLRGGTSVFNAAASATVYNVLY